MISLPSACTISMRTPQFASAKSLNTISMFNLNSPSNGVKSALSVMQVTGVAKNSSAPTVNFQFYLNDSTCAPTHLVGNVTASAGNSFSFHTPSVVTSGEGLKTLYYTSVDSYGVVQACANTGLHYIYQAVPKVSFTQLGYTVKEFSGGTIGVQTGTAVSVQRDECGVPTSVSVTTSDVSAATAVNYVAGTTSVSFAATDCSPKIIPVSTFGIKNDGATTGDLFFKAQIGTITGGVADTQNQIAQINIADSATPGDYLFNQPLYTALPGATSVTLTIHRAGSSIATPGSVVVTLVDASAVNNVDYLNTPQTISFPGGVDEATVTIPITPKGTNVAFIAKLTNASTGTSMRNQGVAKVRILNEPNLCDATTSPFGGGAGTTISPYLICSLAQLEQVATHLTNSFKISTDLVADASLTPLGILTGNFDGGEHVIYNFAFNGAIAGVGLFKSLNGVVGSYFRNLNLLNSRVINTSHPTSALIGAVNGSATHTLSNLLSTGYVSTTSYDAGLLTGIVTTGTTGAVTVSISNILSFGLVKASVGDGAGAIGEINVPAGGVSHSIVLNQMYNAANVINAGLASGGIAGETTNSGTNTFTNLENRGFISGTASVAGIFGREDAVVATAPTENISNCTNYGVITASNHNVGGIVGQWDDYTTAIADNLTNYGAISAPNEDVGGIIGLISNTASNESSTITNSKNYGAVSSNTQGSGGIIGIFIPQTSALQNLHLTMSNCLNQGTITAPTDAGGIIGFVDFMNTANTTNSFGLNGSTNSGNITASGAAGVGGGVVGEISMVAAANPLITVDTSSSSASTVNCSASNQGCGGFLGKISLLGTHASTISNCYSNSAVTGAGMVGGLIGASVQSSGASTLSVSNSFATGTVTSTGINSGGLIGSISNSVGTFTLTKTYATGNISSTAQFTGGLVGQWSTTGASAVSNAINTSYFNATVSGTANVGGLIGQFIADAHTNVIYISNSYSNGAVTGSSTGVAGYIGNLTDSSAGYLTGNFTNSYSTALLSGTSIAGFANLNNATTLIATSYWLKDTGINSAAAADGANQTIAQLQTFSTYSAWDFASIWNNSAPYPTLR